MPTDSIPSLSTVCVYSYQTRVVFILSQRHELIILLHNTTKKSRKSKYKNYIKPLRLYTLQNLQKKKDTEVWH